MLRVKIVRTLKFEAEGFYPIGAYISTLLKVKTLFFNPAGLD